MMLEVFVWLKGLLLINCSVLRVNIPEENMAAVMKVRFIRYVLMLI